MQFFEAIRLALNTIRVQKLKSAFTLLGVCIGVMFLISVVSIVEGMGRYMEEDLIGKLIGVNTFELRSRPNINIGDMDEATWEEYRRRPRLELVDVAPVTSALPTDAKWYITSEDQVAITSATSGKPRTTRVFAVDGQYFDVKNLGVTAGRILSEQELSRGEKSVVIGIDAAERLFPGLDPLGRELKMGGVPYRVVGVAESQGKAFGMSFDNFIVTSWRSPARRLLNSRPNIVDAVAIQSPSPEAMTETMEIVRSVMRAQRHLRPSQKDNFALQTADSALEFWNKIKSYLVLAGIALPAIGLVVGAIVIMNIMLVAVSERTREIGIRKALGAKRRDILMQFLIEASTLGIVGSAIGVALGIGLAEGISAFSPLPASVAPWSIVVGIALGAGVGVVSGVYPASRASRLDPITALRQE
ncbi:ABC transporter permease [Gemmatimonas groenlandica]|uniref:ABC transporter permease n=1 Tax=Gemmatimonas groenlandica TaxID=2732249 RepID=A0A6M4ILP5_9BACT|nr:ABC transporter permease [Gemmatimonas groenlandica]QJR35580.1 ABC transporter permease [Gemmatimonas groenlandica]